MGQVTVTLGLNVELNKGAKFDRIQPNIAMTLDVPSEGQTVEQQVEAQKKAIKYAWKHLSDVMGEQINQELDYDVQWGK